jgi:predicted ATPase
VGSAGELVSARRTPSLVGRSGIVADIARCLGDATDRRGGIVLLEGGAGLGKSRLVQETVSLAVASGAQVIRGAADELEQRRPFGLMADCLRAALPEPRRREVARVLALGSPKPTDSLLDETSVEHEVVEALTAVLEDLCHEQLLVLAIDDVQWMDPGSALVLNRWSRLVPQLASVLLCAYRPIPRPPFISHMLERLVARGAVEHELTPLDDESVDVLAEELTGRPPGPGLRRLLQKAAGNPLFVIELVEGLQRDGAIALDPSGRADADPAFPTPSLSLAILHRLRFLPSDTLPVLRVAAVLGSTFTFTELCLLLHRRPGEVLPAIEECFRADLLRQHGDRLAFRHELIREALYGDTSVGIRKALHRELAA